MCEGSRGSHVTKTQQTVREVKTQGVSSKFEKMLDYIIETFHDLFRDNK